ncbi:hypothetical protein GCM10009092_30130 [Bowmanella denitrificans]|uniref:Glutaredoxin domain-containing protein n=1 Tax=Bowmanella denitrificans TaxID=366582 RepID=A0ABP3HAW6_9ALTE
MDRKTLLGYILLFVVVFAGHHLYGYWQNLDKGIYTAKVGDYSSFGISRTQPLMAFTADWCSACAALKEYLATQNIAYTNVDLEQNPQVWQKFKDMGIHGIPVILIEDKLIQGFNLQLLREHLPHTNTP